MTDTVLVGNISKALSEENIRELFGCVGNIIRFQWLTEEFENSCKISFDNPNCVKAAVLLSGTPLGDRPLSVNECASIAPPIYHGPVPVIPEPLEAFAPDGTAYKRMMTPAETIASLTEAALRMNPSERLDMEKQIEEQKLISCTVYIGNIAPHLTETDVRNFFAQCGNIIYVKMAGNPALGIKYAFMEYDRPESAQMAMALTGSGAMLADRPVKVGPAMNSIVKPAVVAANSDPTRIETAMSRVLRAKQKLEEKALKKRASDQKESSSKSGGTKRSRSKSKSKRRYSSGSKKKRSHSRSVKKSRHNDRHHRKRSRSKSSSNERYDVYKPKYKPPPIRPMRIVNKAQEGLVWDGFQWTRPSGLTIKQKSENLATKIMDVLSSDSKQVNPAEQQAMVQQAHQQAALLKAHMEKMNRPTLL